MLTFLCRDRDFPIFVLSNAVLFASLLRSFSVPKERLGTLKERRGTHKGDGVRTKMGKSRSRHKNVSITVFIAISRTNFPTESSQSQFGCFLRILRHFYWLSIEAKLLDMCVGTGSSLSFRSFKINILRLLNRTLSWPRCGW
jgi:hypothetical protein